MIAPDYREHVPFEPEILARTLSFLALVSRGMVSVNHKLGGPYRSLVEMPTLLPRARV